MFGVRKARFADMSNTETASVPSSSLPLYLPSPPPHIDAGLEFIPFFSADSTSYIKDRWEKDTEKPLRIMLGFLLYYPSLSLSLSPISHFLSQPFTFMQEAKHTCMYKTPTHTHMRLFPFTFCPVILHFHDVPD